MAATPPHEKSLCNQRSRGGILQLRRRFNDKMHQRKKKSETKPREECWRSLSTWNHLTVEIIHAGHRTINTLPRGCVRFIRKKTTGNWHALHLQCVPSCSPRARILLKPACVIYQAKHIWRWGGGGEIREISHLLSGVLLEDGGSGGAALARRRSRRRRRHGASAAADGRAWSGRGGGRGRGGECSEEGGRFFATFAPQCPSSKASLPVRHGMCLHQRLLHPERSQGKLTLEWSGGSEGASTGKAASRIL